MDRRRRAARTVALMSLFSMTDTRENVPVASFDGDGSDLISLIVGIEPIQAGSGDPSPDNVRPISGWTEAKVTRAGKNLLNDGYSSDYDVVLPAGTYYYKRFLTTSDYQVSSRLQVLINGSYTTITDNSSMDNGGIIVSGNMGWGSDASQTIVTNKTYRFRLPISLIQQVPSKMHLIMTVGAMPSEYSTFAGITIPISWQSSAGTVYGGTLDVTTGKLTVDRANIASYNGETLTGRWISDRDVYSAGTTPTIGAQVVYELATPIVYDLTPTQVTTLIGTNNIWADTGDIKYIEYNI